MKLGSWSEVRWRLFGLAIGVLAVIALGVTLALEAYGGWRLQHAKAALEARHVSFDLASYERPSVPPGENAARWLEAGATAILLTEREGEVLRHASASPWSSWDPALERSVAAILAENECALTILHRSEPLTGSSFGIRYREGFQARSPFGRMYQASSLLVAEAKSQLRRNDRTGATTSLRTLTRLIDAANEEPLSGYSGGSAERELVRVASQIATSPRLSEKDKQLIDDVRQLLPTRDPIGQTRHLLAFGAAAWSAWADERSGHLFYRAGIPPWAYRFVSLWIDKVDAAAVLEEYGEAIDLIDNGAVTRPSTRPGSVRYWAVGMGSYWFPGPNPYLGPVARRTAGQRELVRAALELRAAALEGHSYPSTPPSLPALGQAESLLQAKVAYELKPDGSLQLAISNNDAIDLILPSPTASAAPGATR